LQSNEASHDHPIKRDKPWLMRTYSGHTSARASNELYRTNLSKGQTGLSVAFDLPPRPAMTPTIRWPAAKSARSVFPSVTSATWPRCSTRFARSDEHLHDYQRHRRLAAGAVRRGRRAAGRFPGAIAGTPRTTSSRSTCRAAPTSFRLRRRPADHRHHRLYGQEHPQVEPTNICSYHLQEAGATPTQELAYALSTAIAVLDAVRDSGQIVRTVSSRWSGAFPSSSMPASASSRKPARCGRSARCGTS